MNEADKSKAKQLSEQLASFKGDTKVKAKKLSEYTPMTRTDIIDERPETIAAKLNSLEGAIDAKVIRGIPDKLDAKEVVAELKKLQGNDRLDISNIRNGEQLARLANKVSNNPMDGDMKWHGSGITSVSHDSTLTGLGTDASPLSVTVAENYKAKVSSADTTANYLESKFIAGTNITIGKNNTGADETLTISSTSVATTPGGSNTQVQFNDSSAFGGDADFTWNKTTNTMTLGSNATITTPDQKNLNIRTADSSTTFSGDVNIQAGSGIVSGADGGGLYFSSGSGTGNVGHAGPIEIVAGDGGAFAGGGGNGGHMLIEAGAGGGGVGTSIANGGYLHLYAGRAGLAGGTGGNVQLLAGSSEDGQGGYTIIYAGSSGAGNTGGYLELKTLDSNTGSASSAGPMTIATGSGDGVGNGGDLTIQTGSGGSAGTGGNISILSGDGNGGSSNNGGYIELIAGDADTGSTPGNIYLTVGANTTASTSGGDVIVKLVNLSDSASAFQLSNAGIAGGNISYRVVCAGQTTDGTPTQIANVIDLAASQAVMVEARITARRISGAAGADGDAAMYVRRAGFKRASAGSAVQLGATQDVFTVESQAGWDADITLSTNQVQITVTGATNNDVYWSVEFFYLTSTTL